MENKYLKESQVYQNLLNTASKYGVANYVPGQSLDTYKDKMTAEDYETYQKLNQYYNGQKSLTDEYNENSQSIEYNRKKQLQENAISKELAMKYLPEYLKAQGLGGLGVSSSTIVDANNNYRNVSNTINADANSQLSELKKNYLEGIRSYDNDANTESQTIRDKYQEMFENESARNLLSAEGILDSKAGEMMDSNGKISQGAKQELFDYVDKNYKEKLTDSDYESLKSYIEQYKSTTLEEEKLIDEQNYVLNNYGVTSEGLASAVHTDDAGLTSFGEFAGHKNSDGKQNALVRSIITRAKNGKVKNGDIYDFNYGAGRACYVYYNGIWYPTKMKATCSIPDPVYSAE